MEAVDAMEGMTTCQEATMSWFLPAMLPCAPRHAPTSWLRINAFILAWAVVSLVEIAMTLDPQYRLVGTRYYLIYNNTVCIFWALECYLHLLEYQHEYHFPHIAVCGQRYDKPFEKDTSSGKKDADWYEIYLILGELLLAGYYLYDSIHTISILWNVPNFNIYSEFNDVMLDFVAYAYLTWRMMTFISEHSPKEDDSHDGTKDGTSSESSSEKNSSVEVTDYVCLQEVREEIEVSV